MNKILFIALMFCCTLSYSQDDRTIPKKFFTQFEVSFPITANDNEPEDPDSRKTLLMFNGAGSKFGYGFHFLNWASISAHSGVEWKMQEKLVAAPVYADLTINPRIGGDTYLNLQLGYGHSFAIGRGDLSGSFRRISIGLESDEGFVLFLELSEHGYRLNSFDNVSSFSIGLALRSY